MSNTFDLSGLAEELRADIQSVIYSEVIEVCRESLDRAVRMTVYAGGNGGFMYERTREFLNAVEVMDINVGSSKATFLITINSARMNLYPATNTEWGKHEGLSGQDFREGLIQVLDEGGGSILYSHPAHGFFDKSLKDLDSRLHRVIGGSLSGRGWKVTY